MSIFNDHFQNFKRHSVPKAQLIIADIPYNIGINAYGSNPAWYVDGDRKNGESKLAGKEFFDTDKDFRPAEFMHFCSKMMRKEPKETNAAPAMIIFCGFDQQMHLIELAKKYGINGYINLVFRKNFSAQVLKANMRVVGNAEYGLLLYRDKLPKFRNNGKMIFNVMDWESDDKKYNYEKIHPCLPSGEQVFFNNAWINIENVKVGDSNRYGNVIDISSHYAEKIVEISAGGQKTKATWNHPFLVKRANNIYWLHACEITKDDCLLVAASVYGKLKPYSVKENAKCQQRKGISDFKKMQMAGCAWSIALFGKGLTGKFLWACKYITKIITRQTTIFPTCRLSVPLNISGCTLVAESSTANGKSLAKHVKSLRNAIKKIGTFQGDISMGNYAKNALLEKVLMKERYVLQKVGSVKITQEKTKVYNLTMDNIPAFDTKIGVSHNTQKPVKLLEKLISIFTDEGDVVIDPCAGSGSTLIAANNLNRKGYGFEIKKDFYKKAKEWIEESSNQQSLFQPENKQTYKKTVEMDLTA